MADLPSLINEILDSYLLEKYREEEKNRPPRSIGHYYVSDLIKCLREWWFDFFTPKEVPPERLRIFERGLRIEGFVTDALQWAKDRGGKISFAKPQHSLVIVVDPKERIYLHGRYDMMIRLEDEEGRRYLLEIKSVKSNIDSIVESKEEHVLQIHPYMLGENCEEGLIIYLGAGNYADKSFLVKYDENVIQKIFERTRIGHKYIKNKMIPPQEARLCPSCGKGHMEEREFSILECAECGSSFPYQKTKLWRCNFCAHQRVCEMMGEEGNKTLNSVRWP